MNLEDLKFGDLYYDKSEEIVILFKEVIIYNYGSSYSELDYVFADFNKSDLNSSIILDGEYIRNNITPISKNSNI